MPQPTMTAPQRTNAIAQNTALGTARLIAESDDGTYEPITLVASINEAIEIATDNFARRIKKAERGGTHSVKVRR